MDIRDILEKYKDGEIVENGLQYPFYTLAFNAKKDELRKMNQQLKKCDEFYNIDVMAAKIIADTEMADEQAELMQKDVNEKMRAILIDWLVDVHAKFKMNHQTLFLTVNIIDRYLEQVPVPRTQLQLVGIASLFVASKYEEIYPPDLKEFVKCCDHTYSADQIIEVESHIILILNFNLVFTSAYQFFELFSQKSKL